MISIKPPAACTIPPLAIMHSVCCWHGISWPEFCSRTMASEVVAARHEAWFLCTLLTGYSQSHIGRLCGRLPATITKAVREYTGLDRSDYILRGLMPPSTGERIVDREAQYGRTYLRKLRADGRYENYLVRKRRKYHERKAAREAVGVSA